MCLPFLGLGEDAGFRESPIWEYFFRGFLGPTQQSGKSLANSIAAFQSLATSLARPSTDAGQAEATSRDLRFRV